MKNLNLKSLFLAASMMAGSSALAQETQSTRFLAPQKKKYDATLTYIQGGRQTEQESKLAKKRLIAVRLAAYENLGTMAYIEIGGNNKQIDTTEIRNGMSLLKKIKSDRHLVILDFSASVTFRNYGDTTVYTGQYFTGVDTLESSAMYARDVFTVIGDALENIRDNKDEAYDILALTPGSASLMALAGKLPVNSRLVTLCDIHEDLYDPLRNVMHKFSPEFYRPINPQYMLEMAVLCSSDKNNTIHAAFVDKGKDDAVMVNGNTVYSTPNKKVTVANLRHFAIDLPVLLKTKEYQSGRNNSDSYIVAADHHNTTTQLHKSWKGKLPPFDSLDAPIRKISMAMALEGITTLFRDGFAKNDGRTALAVLYSGSDFMKEKLIVRPKEKLVAESTLKPN